MDTQTSQESLPAAILLHIPADEPISRRELINAVSAHTRAGQNKVSEVRRDILDAKEAFPWRAPAHAPTP